MRPSFDLSRRGAATRRRKNEPLATSVLAMTCALFHVAPHSESNSKTATRNGRVRP